MDGQPLIDEKKNDVAALLRRMADHVDRNAGATFGGCAVIVPPTGGGDPIELFVLDSKGDAGAFYATLKTRIDTQLAELTEQAARIPGFGIRR